MHLLAIRSSHYMIPSVHLKVYTKSLTDVLNKLFLILDYLPLKLIARIDAANTSRSSGQITRNPGKFSSTSVILTAILIHLC